MDTLFKPGNIGSMKLKNRMIRSATWEGMCDPDGRPTEKLIQCYTELAKGGIGLIISGYIVLIRKKEKQILLNNN